MKARAKARWQLEAEENMLINISSCLLGSQLLALSAHSSLITQAYIVQVHMDLCVLYSSPNKCLLLQELCTFGALPGNVNYDP